jgi:hypothetical protein
MRNNTSVVSFVISIVSIYTFSIRSLTGLIISTVLAMLCTVLGIVSLRQIKKLEQRGRSWAIASIVIGGCGIGIAISSFLAILNSN